MPPLRLLALAALLLGACTLSPPSDGARLDLMAYKADLDGTRTDITGYRIDALNSEIIVNNDGTASYTPSRSFLTTTQNSSVLRFDSQEICLARSGSWLGLCLAVYSRPDGSLTCHGRFGNGTSFIEPCAISAIPPRNDF